MGNRIRPAGPLDLLPLSVPPGMALQLDLAQQLLSPYHRLRELVSSWLHPQQPPCTLLCRGKSGLLACAQARLSPRTDSWEVRYLAVWGDTVATAHTLWEELLTGLGVAAGRQGVVRLLAHLPAEEHLEPFQRAGFLPFAEEMILAWEETDKTAVEPLPALRPVQGENVWAIQQLHIALTPPRVQQTEGYSSDSWLPQRGEEAWVWQEEDRARAYLRRRRGPRGTVLKVLLDPACRQQAPPVLSHGLVGARPPVYLILRSYQGELLEVARRLGFRPYAEQILLAKYLAVLAKQSQPLPARSPERKLGAAPSTPSVGNLGLLTVSPSARRKHRGTSKQITKG